MKLAIVNAFYPPDSAITGVAASELVETLRDAAPSLEVAVFATDRSYDRAGEVVAGGPVERIPAAFRRSGSLLRLAGSVWDGIRLARRACRDADVVVAMSDPPLLGLWVALESRRKGRLWVDWTMDLYPEAFVAAGLISARSVVYRSILGLMRRFQPERYICLGTAQHRWMQAHRAIDRPAFHYPCGICDVQASEPPAWRRDDRIVLAYAGNVGKAHSAEQLAAIVRRADPAVFAFVLSIYGAKSARVKELIGDRSNVTWCSHLSHADLAHADAHIVSLLGAWSHICVPSKAVAAVCLGRPILFAGSPDTDTWGQFAGAGWLIAERADGSYESGDIDRALRSIADRRQLSSKAQRAAAIGLDLRRSAQEEVRRLAVWLAAQDPVVATAENRVRERKSLPLSARPGRAGMR